VTRPAETLTGREAVIASLAEEVRYYLTLTPRQLPSSALYDRLGSALFDAICELPWYPVTRAERRLIASHRVAIFAATGRPTRLVELGGGNGAKLRLLLGEPGDPASRGVGRIDLIDVSPAALASAVRVIGENRVQVRIVTHANRYEDGLAAATSARRADERIAVLFLGSNIGNFDPPAASALLVSIRAALCSGDALILGADLVKPEAALMAAYDDPLGVTAAFNKNLLLHLNAALGADFDLTGFDHRALWNAPASRVEMHLVSRRQQTVTLPRAGLTIELDAEEPIWTESSYKYDVSGVEALLGGAGFAVRERWIDGEGQFLLAAAGAV
jgi:dimethylhistidine N-methyltransferase